MIFKVIFFVEYENRDYFFTLKYHNNKQKKKNQNLLNQNSKYTILAGTKIALKYLEPKQSPTSLNENNIRNCEIKTSNATCLFKKTIF